MAGTAATTRRSETDRALSNRVPSRALGLIALDAGAWIVGVLGAYWLRMDFSWPGASWQCWLLVATAVLARIAIGSMMHLYSGWYLVGSADEVGKLGATDALTMLVVFATNFGLGRPVPASVPIGAALIALVLSGGVRFASRRRTELQPRQRLDGATRLLVVGAGSAGTSIVEQLLQTPASPYLPVGFIDDDTSKRHLRISGVPVLGSRADLARVAREVDATTLLFAIPTACTALVRDVARAAAQNGLRMSVLPSVDELLDGRISVADIRPLTDDELLGRSPVAVNAAEVAECVRGKRVLVTGAGGSIGSELCRQLARLDPEKLVLLDRDESALHATKLSISGQALFVGDDVVVADVRDAARIDEVFESYRPQIVFHAAALKHLALLEFHPGEALKTNVYGSENVVRAALAYEVETFVNISTDKAADPVSVLGFTKRITERLTAWAAGGSDGRFVSVRFGNVLGSRGSLLETFRAQIDANLPITVTHSEVTRYFMTVEEAVQLVLEASVIGQPGQVLVLDMGEPISIREFAERLLAGTPDAPEIVYTGLRRGEKLHESLFAADESDERPFHPAISHLSVPPLDPRAFKRLDGLPERDLVVALAALSQQPDDGGDSAFSEPAYLVLDNNGLIASASVAARTLLATRHENLVGRSLSEFAESLGEVENSSSTSRGFPAELADIEAHEMVVPVRRGDGRTGVLVVSAHPILEGAGLLIELRELPSSLERSTKRLDRLGDGLASPSRTSTRPQADVGSPRNPA